MGARTRTAVSDALQLEVERILAQLVADTLSAQINGMAPDMMAVAGMIVELAQLAFEEKA